MKKLIGDDLQCIFEAVLTLEEASVCEMAQIVHESSL